MKKEKLERITVFKPAYDKRNNDPKKNYGIGGVTCCMVLKGKKGAVHFIFSTGMLLPETITEYIKSGKAKYELTSYGHYFLNRPMGYDVGFHSPKPMFEGHEVRWNTKVRKIGNKPYDITFEKIGKRAPICEWIGVPCYCDGSALRSEDWLDIFLREGSDKIWKMLEKDYYDRFKR